MGIIPCVLYWKPQDSMDFLYKVEVGERDSREVCELLQRVDFIVIYMSAKGIHKS